MTNIGTFTRTTEGYSGTLKTLTVNAKVRLVQTNGIEGENAPNYRVIVDTDTEIGAAWKRVGKKVGDYVSVALDDPAFALPIRANLIQSNSDQKTFHLLWTRPPIRRPAPQTASNTDVQRRTV